MIIGIPKETLLDENRVAILPNEIKRLSSSEITFQALERLAYGSEKRCRLI